MLIEHSWGQSVWGNSIFGAKLSKSNIPAPSLYLDFLKQEYVVQTDPISFEELFTFIRSTAGGRFNAAGMYEQVAADVQRIDYDPVTLLPRGLLIEEQRTNIMLRSSELDNAIWAKNGGSVTANATIAPDGTLTADKFSPNSASVTFSELQQNFSTVSGTTYTCSWFVKPAGYRYVQFVGTGGQFGTFAINIDLNTGLETQFTAGNSTILGRGIISLPNGWYRVWVAATALASITNGARFGLDVIPAATSARGVTWPANGTDGIFQWGGQVEVGAFPTSYIPTTTAQVTRAADAPAINTLSPWYNTSAGTFFAECSHQYPDTTGSTKVVLSANAGNTNNRVTLASTGVATFGRVTLSGAENNIANLGYTPGSNVKSVIALAPGSAVMYTNGQANGSSFPASVPTVSKLEIGYQTTGLQLNGHIRTFRYYPRRLMNPALQALTA